MYQLVLDFQLNEPSLNTSNFYHVIHHEGHKVLYKNAKIQIENVLLQIKT